MKLSPIGYNQNVSGFTKSSGLTSKTTSANKPAFTSQYEIDGNSIISREQVFALGTLMNNFWLYDTRNTFYDIKRKNVMGKFTVKVNNMRDKAFEEAMQRNNIKFTKKEGNSYYGYYY